MPSEKMREKRGNAKKRRENGKGGKNKYYGKKLPK